MSQLPDDYLQYPHRRYGYDHDRFEWSMLAERPPISWPDGRTVAFWLNVSLQFFPLNQRGVPFKVPNGMTMPYPDLRHFSLREYGNRVGIYRLFQAFDRHRVKPTCAVNAALARRAPYLLQRLLDRDAELICHGWNMDLLHYGGQDLREETELVWRSVDTLRSLSGKPVRGWLSPARNQSWHTLDLLVDNGIEYCCDWVNDDLPYPCTTEHGTLMMLPLSTEIEDQFVLCNNLHSEDSWVEQVKDALAFLLEEAEQTGSGRLLALSIHPWLLGQPHRIGCLEEVLEHVMGHDRVWHAGAGEILDCFLGQQTPAGR